MVQKRINLPSKNLFIILKVLIDKIITINIWKRWF